jgi:hypothetical protein
MLRLLVVFVHVCGAMGLFGAAAIEGASLLQLHAPGGAPVAMRGFGLARRVGSLSFALTLASGIALTQAIWGWQAHWISVALAALGVMILIGATTSRRAMERLRVSVNPSTVSSALTFSFVVRASLLIGIVFLMTVKPPLGESLIAIAIAGSIGVLFGMPSRRRRAVVSGG